MLCRSLKVVRDARLASLAARSAIGCGDLAWGAMRMCSAPRSPSDDPVGAYTGALGYAEVASSIWTMFQHAPNLSIGDLAFGIQVLARQHADEARAYRVEGEEVTGDRQLLLDVLDAIDLSYGVYKRNKQSLAALSHLKVGSIVRFVPDNTLVRPAYFLAVDERQRALVWGFRGTKNLIDVLTDLGGAITPYAGGHAHFGMLHGAAWFARHELPRVAALSRRNPGFHLHLVGHSLGAGVAALLAHMLVSKPELRARLPHVPSIRCIGIATPACVSADLADASAGYVTSVVHAHDAVPRFSLAALHALQVEVLASNWQEKLRGDILEHDHVRALVRSIELVSRGPAEAAARLQAFSEDLLGSRHVRAAMASLQLPMASVGDLLGVGAAAAAGRQAMDGFFNLMATARAGELALMVGWRGDQAAATQQGPQDRQQSGAAGGRAAAASSSGGMPWPPLPPLPAWASADSAKQALSSWLGMQTQQAGGAVAGDRKCEPAAGTPESEGSGAGAADCAGPSTGAGLTAAAPPQPPGMPVIPLYPPGRLLFLAPEGAPAGEAAAAAADAAGAAQARVSGGEGGSRARTRPRHALISAHPGQRFSSLIIHPSMLADHRTQAYRSAVVAMLRRCPAD